MINNLAKIKKLRSLTKAGVIDCQKALSACANDFNRAKKWLEKRGLTKAIDKKNRQIKAGLIAAYIHNNNCLGSIVHLGCETDFVARTKEFKELAHEIAMQVAAMKPKTLKELENQDYIREPQKTISHLIKEKISQLGENIKIVNFYWLEV